mgnify:CR=1 FL=1
MATTNDVHGPVDFLVLEFQAARADGQMAAALLDLVDRGIVAIYDVIVMEKAADGTLTVIELSDLAADHLGGLTVLAGAQSGLLGEDDLGEAAAAIEPGMAAAVIVYENLWAVPFVAAAREVGAEFVASGRIPAEALIAALDELGDD